MGDMADDAYMHMMKYEAQYESYEREADEMLEKYKLGILQWVKKNTDTILVQNMDNNHVINTQKMLLRTKDENPIRLRWVAILEMELLKRGLIKTI